MINPMCFDGFEPLLSFSTWLDEQLIKRRMTVTVLAKVTGLTKQSIVGYRLGKHEPSLYAVREICKAFNCTLGVVPSKESTYVRRRRNI